MPDPETVLNVVRQWVEKAEEDLLTAEHMLTLQDNCPLSTVCFHAQQCVEKYIKALLCLHHIDFPKTHNIPELIALIPGSLEVGITANEEETLTDYATGIRYPGDWEPLTREESEQAVAIATKVRAMVRSHFPKNVIE